MRLKDKTNLKDIAIYWRKNPYCCETELNFDWIDNEKVCWNCAKETKSLERCHIIPHSLNGIDEPNNYVLLCNQCHKQAPNNNNKNYMWEWIKSNKTPISLYNTYLVNNSLIEFKKKEGYSFLSKAINIKNLEEKIINELKNNTISHGVHYNISTIHYLLKSIINNQTI